MATRARTVPLLALAVWLAPVACVDPQDRRPGLWLRGEVADALPDDWAFTDAHPEIALEVRTPYWIRHSVTIWCAVADGHLYVGARDPESKRWPGWVERDPRVRLGIGGTVYEARLERVADPEHAAAVRAAYADKYDLPEQGPDDAPPMRYWRVAPRAPSDG